MGLLCHEKPTMLRLAISISARMLGGLVLPANHAKKWGLCQCSTPGIQQQQQQQQQQHVSSNDEYMVAS
jgi:hypothetical protein